MQLLFQLCSVKMASDDFDRIALAKVYSILI